VNEPETPLRAVNKKRILQKMLVCGLALLIGGEIFCFVGLPNRPALLHISCHAVAYSGAGICAGAVFLHLGWRNKRP
jgi:hypothetical protein